MIIPTAVVRAHQAMLRDKSLQRCYEYEDRISRTQPEVTETRQKPYCRATEPVEIINYGIRLSLHTHPSSLVLLMAWFSVPTFVAPC